MSLPAKDKKFDIGFDLVDKNGKPTQLFRDYMTMVDRLLTAIAAGQAPTLVNAANDAAAAVAGVPVGSLYRNGSVVQMRVV
ncbi:hypothetical protein [Pseudomonas proteolytica]|uniref:hypothetical protein n=1 Tax=Pseudomonas proteolytica TaxID=219574 RepID=UPI0030DC1DE9